MKRLAKFNEEKMRFLIFETEEVARKVKNVEPTDVVIAKSRSSPFGVTSGVKTPGMIIEAHRLTREKETGTKVKIADFNELFFIISIVKEYDYFSTELWHIMTKNAIGWIVVRRDSMYIQYLD
jgi:hypothetical protein